MSRLKSTALKLGIAGELLVFFAQRKRWWLLPMVSVLLLLGILMVATQGSVVAPLVYALF